MVVTAAVVFLQAAEVPDLAMLAHGKPVADRDSASPVIAVIAFSITAAHFGDRWRP
jgi:hypothetical protein